MRSTQMTGGFWRAFLVVSLALGAFAYGCGRTSLDDGFGTNDGGGSGGTTGSGGQAGTAAGGQGGASSGGQGGNGGGTLVPCGTTACVPGKQFCCNQLAAGQITSSCVSSSDPMACNNGLVTCTANSSCPAATPTCCSQGGIGICLPRNIPCNTGRP